MKWGPRKGNRDSPDRVNVEMGRWVVVENDEQNEVRPILAKPELRQQAV